MLIDADCHLSSQKFDAISLTAPELIEQMDRAGVDRALVWLKPPYNKDIDPENRAIYDAMRAHPQRLLGFGWANPQLGKQHTLDTIRRCFEEYGFYGIKFNGAQDYYVIDDPAILPYIEAAAVYGKPIAFHIGSDYYENTHPYRLGHIAARFPETRFLMVHMGGASIPTLDRSAIETAQQYSNIILTGSSINEMAILRAIRALGPERVCFGSDTPFRLMHVQLAMYQALLRDTPAADREKILGGNLARLLNV
jgi:predicted TIM-barrel fold metal-dependent hydrolase